jgi:FkbM family methyltransferase
MMLSFRNSLIYFKKIVKKILGIKNIEPIDYKNSYSQEGEDMILAKIFEGKIDGFYVDVGAHHPKRFSNTYYFYLLGWQGINIDAMPDSMKLFKEIRPNDINLEIGISDSRKKLIYHAFAEPAYNSFCQETSEAYSNIYKFKKAFEKEIQTYSLSEVLEKYLPSEQNIDFLSVDVEGLDYEILLSNNWQKYSPTVVLVEDLQQTSMEQANESKVTIFLKQRNYTLTCKTKYTLIFEKN